MDAQEQASGQEKHSIHIIFVASVEIKTGRLYSRNISGTFEDIVDTKRLERNFNAQKQEGEDVISKAFSVRYGFPYVAPMVKGLMD